MHDQVSEENKGNRFLQEPQVIVGRRLNQIFQARILKMVIDIGKGFYK